MTQEMVISIGREALTLTLLVSAPMLLLALVVGLAISIFQAVTQINEVTITFIPKIIAVSVALLVFLPWMIHMVVDFTTRLYALIPTMT